MNWLHLLQILASIIAVGVALGAGIGGFFYAFKSKENKLLREESKSCDLRLKEAFASIHNLEGQVQIIKEIPLQTIATSLAELTRTSADNAKTNSSVLALLTAKAKIDAEDRDVLTNQNLHIKNEVIKELSKGRAV